MGTSYSIEEAIKFLGFKVEDKVTNFAGVATHVGFDLYGCIQAVVTPPVTKGGEQRDNRWFDIGRLNIISPEPVMDVPDFSMAEPARGPESKPLPRG